jgi:hypothetical protein
MFNWPKPKSPFSKTWSGFSENLDIRTLALLCEANSNTKFSVFDCCLVRSAAQLFDLLTFDAPLFKQKRGASVPKRSKVKQPFSSVGLIDRRA